MSKSLRDLVFDRAMEFDNGYPICEACGNAVAEEFHHSIGGNGKRRQHQSMESCYALCRRCHNLIESNKGYALRMELINRTQQRYIDQGFDEDEIRKLMGGKIY